MVENGKPADLARIDREIAEARDYDGTEPRVDADGKISGPLMGELDWRTEKRIVEQAAKLTAEKVIAIREARGLGESFGSILRRTGFSLDIFSEL